MTRLDGKLAVAWLLDPAKRKALYAILPTVGVLLVTFGVANDSLITGVTGIVITVLDCAALLLASWKARRADWTAVYAALAAVVAALKVAGVINDGQSSHALDILSQGIAVIPLVVAFVRTSTKTPTGEPEAEYVARHAARLVVAADPRGER